MKVPDSKAKNASSRNERGFTMLEMLLSMLVFLMIASLLPLGLGILLEDSVIEKGIRGMEWEVFSSQVKKEIRAAEQMTVQPDKLLLKVEGQFILYEKYASSMRRRVNYQGHEILFQNLSSFTFEQIADGVMINAVDSNQTKYSVRVHQFHQTGGVQP
ncbi:competence type IV pilus minor pilin ComGF [Mesobacillus jeotgali]|uniref:competence type IV pilus minor pilin ComGF n=1 Tax=Mesobacillus jeotgali TaxID=129985 RepID=UPI001115B332|nr:competence type IV pilus minor pilin ComGF [Mesobacillus jeotgali]